MKTGASGPWMAASALLFGVAVWAGISARNASIEAGRIAQAAAAASAQARADKSALESRLAAAEDKAKTLQGILDQTVALQDQRARADQANRTAQLQPMQAQSVAVRPNSIVPSTPQPSFSGPAASAPVQPETPLALKVLSGDVRFVSTSGSGDYVTWSWKAKILNPTGVPLSATVTCELQDRSGFRLETSPNRMEALGPRRTVELTGDGFTAIAVWERYKRHRFLVE